MTTYINCEKDNVSLGIQAELSEGDTCTLVGFYEHPRYRGSNDWTIGLYKVETPEGFETRAMSTNGDPVWEENDLQAFSDMLEEYGVK